MLSKVNKGQQSPSTFYNIKGESVPTEEAADSVLRAMVRWFYHLQYFARPVGGAPDQI